MTELEKNMQLLHTGDLYVCNSPEMFRLQMEYRSLIQQYNQMDPRDMDGRAALLPLLCPLALKDCQGTFLMAYLDGAMGEASTLLLLVGAAYLAMRHLLPWAVAVPYLCASFLTAAVLPHCDPLAVVCWGGTILGACFLSADPVTTPMGLTFRVLYGVFTGAVATVFSFYGWGMGGVVVATLAANTAFRAAETIAARLQNTAELEQV